MTEPGRVTITISKHRIRSNRTEGQDEPVIRVSSDGGNVFAREVHIKGESRVVYHPDRPLACGSDAWVETDSEVVPIDPVSTACAPVPTRSVGEPPLREPSPLGRVLDSGLLEKGAAQLASLLERQPGRADLWRRLGDLRRQAGRLEEAAEAYERALALGPADPATERLVASLRGLPLPASLATWPARYARYDDFLPAERLQEVLDFTVRHREVFLPTAVMSGGQRVVEPKVRWCTSVFDIGPLEEWFVPLVEARLPEIAERLACPVRRLEIRDCKLTHYGDGSYFRTHIDRGPGVETRVFGFILYFHFPPRRYTGGGLALYDWDLETGEAAPTCTTLIPEQNQLLVLSSHCWHEVLPVRCPTGEWDAGRFTLNGWVHRVG